jgi:hypothetical protein
MALGTFIAGRYSMTYQAPSDSARSGGIQEKGYYLDWSYKKDVLDRTDQFGQGVKIESFLQGVNVHLSGVAKEQLSGVMKMINPFNGWAGTGVSNFNMGVVGVQDSDNSGIVILTATAGTPAAASPATLTATLCILAEDFDVTLLFGPEHRTYPWRFSVLPYLASGTTYRYFSST